MNNFSSKIPDLWSIKVENEEKAEIPISTKAIIDCSRYALVDLIISDNVHKKIDYTLFYKNNFIRT